MNLIQIPTSKPVISVKEARKLLGRESRQLDDYQVQEIITLLTLMARQNIDDRRSSNSNGGII